MRLWRPAREPFRWIGDHVPRWLDEAERSTSREASSIPLARELYASLDVGRAMLVHGDFHHHNILDAGGRYLAIDPKAMLGEPEFDVPSFLWNPLPYQMTTRLTERRLAAFAAAGLDEEADARLDRDPRRLPGRRRGRGRGVARAPLIRACRAADSRQQQGPERGLVPMRTASAVMWAAISAAFDGSARPRDPIPTKRLERRRLVGSTHPPDVA